MKNNHKYLSPREHVEVLRNSEILQHQNFIDSKLTRKEKMQHIFEMLENKQWCKYVAAVVFQGMPEYTYLYPMRNLDYSKRFADMKIRPKVLIVSRHGKEVKIESLKF